MQHNYVKGLKKCQQTFLRKLIKQNQFIKLLEWKEEEEKNLFFASFVYVVS